MVVVIGPVPRPQTFLNILEHLHGIQSLGRATVSVASGTKSHHLQDRSCEGRAESIAASVSS